MKASVWFVGFWMSRKFSYVVLPSNSSIKTHKNKGKERRRLLPSFPPFLSKLFVFYAHLWSNFLSTVLFRIESSRAAKEATWWFNDGHTKPVAFSFSFFFQKRNRLKAQRGTDIKETNCDVYKAGLKAIENEKKKNWICHPQTTA